MRIVLGCTGVWEMKLCSLGRGGASDSGSNNVTLGKSYPSGSPFLRWGCPGDWGGCLLCKETLGCPIHSPRK